MVAGAPLPVAVRLAFSMLGIQVAIGSLNDRADAARDAVVKPSKPIPAGFATPREALALATIAGVAGLALSAPSGVPTALIAGLGLALGIAYDVQLSSTRWSWLPLALALPLVPVHAWLGVTGAIPTGLLPLLPVGLLAGAALAVANGLVDLERDTATRRPAAVVSLGPRWAWRVNVVLLLGVAAVVLTVAPGAGEGPAGRAGSVGLLPPGALGTLRTWGIAAGIAALGLGAAALRLGRPSLRERGWELEAIGIAAVGLGWVAGVAASSEAGA
jgi:4-hydroxybenzoate polyprenyltransferase